MSDFFETSFGMALTAIVMAALALGGLIWFGLHAAELLAWLLQDADVISFEKGAMYMLGAGIGVVCLLVMSTPRVFFDRTLPEPVERWVVRSLLLGFVIMLALPHLVHFGLWTTLNSRNYVICEDLGSRWLMHVKLVYTSTPERCLEEMVSRR